MKQQITTYKLIKTDKAQVFRVIKTAGKENEFIGFLDKAGEGTLILSRDQNHLVYESFGLPYSLLQSPQVPFTWVRIEYGGRLYISSRNYFLYRGHFLDIPEQEASIYVTLQEMKLSIARQFQNTLGTGLYPLTKAPESYFTARDVSSYSRQRGTALKRN